MNQEGNKVIFTCVIKNICVIVSQFRDYKSQRHIEQRGSFGPFQLVHENSKNKFDQSFWEYSAVMFQYQRPPPLQ